MNEPEFLTRRRFLQALAASVVAAAQPLPFGFPQFREDKIDMWEFQFLKDGKKVWNTVRIARSATLGSAFSYSGHTMGVEYRVSCQRALPNRT